MKRPADQMDIQPSISLSHAAALRRRMDVVANNIANMNTSGFRREDSLFAAAPTRVGGNVPMPLRQANHVIDLGLSMDRKAGPMVATGSQLDIAIEGEHWLAVESPDGDTAYTRAGHLQVLPTGELALSSGEIVLGEGGLVIALSEDETDISIGTDGTVSTSEGIAGRIELWAFQDGARPARLGGGLYRAEAIPVDATETNIRAGMIEGSNVEPIGEMTKMIDILRSYQASQSLNDKINDLRSRSIERLGRVTP
ncbi:MAG: flagellar hook-basal body complex protein [Pacificimonas sp.]